MGDRKEESKIKDKIGSLLIFRVQPALEKVHIHHLWQIFPLLNHQISVVNHQIIIVNVLSWLDARMLGPKSLRDKTLFNILLWLMASWYS